MLCLRDVLSHGGIEEAHECPHVFIELCVLSDQWTVCVCGTHLRPPNNFYDVSLHSVVSSKSHLCVLQVFFWGGVQLTRYFVSCTCGVWVCVSRKHNKQELASFNIRCFLFSLFFFFLLLSAATMNTHLKYSGWDLLTRDFCSTNRTDLRGWWDTIQYYVHY